MVEPLTTMASLRRLMMRKRRCFYFLLFGCLVVTVISASFHLLTASVPSPVVEDFTLQPLKPKEPKYNVLEPPNIINDNSNVAKDVRESIVMPQPKPNIKATPGPGETVKNNSIIISEAKTFQNKTEDIEVVKNKTLSQLGVIGAKDNTKNIPKIVSIKHKWNLTVSFEDIGNIMKDTAFLNKLKPLNLSGPMLTSTRNRTANFSLSMPLKMGYCDCWERYCYCCVQVENKQLHLSNKTCANFTFISKSHELDITFSIDNKTIHSGIISADAPPLLCLGSIPAVADLCVHFTNMTYKVDRLGLHKSQILGCMGVSLNIYNKTISVFPVDCFQIPGDPNHHPKQEHIILPNFVP